jgi:hypothetical protein
MIDNRINVETREFNAEAPEYVIKVRGSGVSTSYVYQIKGRAETMSGHRIAFVSPVRTRKTGKASSFAVQSNNCRWIPVGYLTAL